MEVEPAPPVVDPPPAPEPKPAEIKEKKGIVVPFGSQTKSTATPSKTQAPDPNILWGATASAAIAAFAAQIAERKRLEEEARKRAARAKAQRCNQIARDYQASLNNYQAQLEAQGLSSEAARELRKKSTQGGTIPPFDAAISIATEYKAKKEKTEAAVAEIDAEKKIGYLDPEVAVPPPLTPEKSKLVDAQEVAEASKPDEEKSWWEKTYTQLTTVANAFNWSLQSPSEITLFETPGFKVAGGTRFYYEPEITLNNQSPVTMGANSISLGNFSVGPESLTTVTGISTFDKLNSALNVDIPDIPLAPLDVKISVDYTKQEGNWSSTNRFGIEIVARPDNLSIVTAAVGIVLLGYYVVGAVGTLGAIELGPLGEIGRRVWQAVLPSTP